MKEYTAWVPWSSSISSFPSLYVLLCVFLGQMLCYPRDMDPTTPKSPDVIALETEKFGWYSIERLKFEVASRDSGHLTS